MKRADLIRHIESHGYVLVREGAKHTVYRNPTNGQATTIPRHREVKRHLGRKFVMISESLDHYRAKGDDDCFPTNRHSINKTTGC
jgi:mRNA interferase HicA